MFLSSQRVPSRVAPFGMTDTFASQRNEPSSRLPSFTPSAIRIARSVLRYSIASSMERRSGSQTISSSGTPARLRSTPDAVGGDVVQVLAGVLLHVDAGEPDPARLAVDA